MKAKPLYFKTNVSYYPGHIGRSQTREDPSFKVFYPFFRAVCGKATCPYHVLYWGVLLYMTGCLRLGHKTIKHAETYPSVHVHTKVCMAHEEPHVCSFNFLSSLWVQRPALAQICVFDLPSIYYVPNKCFGNWLYWIISEEKQKSILSQFQLCQLHGHA